MKSKFAELPVKNGKSGNWTLDSFVITPEKAQTLKLRAEYTKDQDEYIPAGVYRRLSCDNEVVMSNTPMEIRTCEAFIERATGRILINGLGLGMVLHAILQKPDVTHVTVIEKSQDVMNLVSKAFAHDPRVEIILADALNTAHRQALPSMCAGMISGQIFRDQILMKWKRSNANISTCATGRTRGVKSSVKLP
jgi:hypothetical protein